MNIFKRMSRTLAEAGPTLRVTLFMGEAAYRDREFSPISFMKNIS
jgi:hypothetical protein